MLLVAKRDGETVEFQLDKITLAIKKAFKATGKSYTADIIELLSLRVTSDFQEKIKDSRISVEDIQDSVEKVLEESGYTDVAKAYILYRKQREKIRNLDKTILDYKDVVDNYVKVEDWRVKENSTITYSVGGLILNNSGAVTANYWLTEVYDREISDAHVNGDIHIHDLSMLTSYSCGWSLRKLLLDGLGGITGKITASPAKHLATLCNQMVNFLGIMQNEWAASQSFSSFDTYLAPFIKADSLSYDKVKKCMEAFVFGVQHPQPLGYPGSVFPYFHGPEGAGGHGWRKGHCGRQENGFYIWGLPEGDGHGEPGISGDHAGRRCQWPGIPISHSGLWDRSGL